MVKGGGRRKKCHNEGKKKYVAEEKEKAKKGINTKWYIMKRENKNWEINMETIQRWSRAQSHKHSGPWRGEWYWKLVCWLICCGHSNGPPKLTPGTANRSPCVVKETLQVQLSVWALRWRDYPGLSEWGQSNPKGLLKKRAFLSRVCQRGLWPWKKGAKAQSLCCRSQLLS